MSIEKHKGKIGLLCDECGNELKNPNGSAAWYDSEDFDVMIADAKDSGWKLFKNDRGVWEHTCDDCS